MTGIRLAAQTDIPELVRLRALLFADLETTWGPLPSDSTWRQACAAALAKELAEDAMRVVVIDAENGGLACCAMAAIDHRLPSPANPSGRIGHVFGVVTDPLYRRRGHADAALRALLDWFDEQGLTTVDLNASPVGDRVYRSLGFTDHPDAALRRTRPA